MVEMPEEVMEMLQDFEPVQRAMERWPEDEAEYEKLYCWSWGVWGIKHPDERCCDGCIVVDYVEPISQEQPNGSEL